MTTSALSQPRLATPKITPSTRRSCRHRLRDRDPFGTTERTAKERLVWCWPLLLFPAASTSALPRGDQVSTQHVAEVLSGGVRAGVAILGPAPQTLEGSLVKRLRNLRPTEAHPQPANPRRAW